MKKIGAGVTRVLTSLPTIKTAFSALSAACSKALDGLPHRMLRHLTGIGLRLVVFSFGQRFTECSR